VYLLPYVEQGGLLDRIMAVTTNPQRRVKQAFNNSVLPAVVPLFRCPTDPFDPLAPVSSYGASVGPQCTPGPCTAPQSPYRTYCNGTAQSPSWGYASSKNYGDTTDVSQARGMFTRQGAKINITMVTDGASNTILLGEILPGQNGDVYYSLGKN